VTGIVYEKRRQTSKNCVTTIKFILKNNEDLKEKLSKFCSNFERFGKNFPQFLKNISTSDHTYLMNSLIW
jgi:hypothetical protein